MAEFSLHNPFIKTAALMNLEAAWRTLGEVGDTPESALYRRVAYLFRGVDLRANAVGLMPFEILRGGDVIDGSNGTDANPGAYQNKLGWLPSPRALFSSLEASLTVFGNAYAFKVLRGTRLDRLRYIAASSVSVDIDPETGEPTFKRRVGSKIYDYTAEQIVYLWRSDPYVEKGPATSSALTAAASAAGVTKSVNEFASAYFERGAIKATLLTTKGNVQEAERAKLKTWWQRITGGNNAWGAHVVNADAVEPVIIGEGLSELSNKELSDEQREQIATALGVPHSILFSNSANFATAKQDDLNFYQKTILPEIALIEEVLNEQVFEPLGYQLRFLPDTLDIFQEDEKERAASLSFLTGVLEKGEIALAAMQIMGYELDADTEELLRRIWQDKRAMAESIQQAPANDDDDNIADADTTPSQADIRALFDADLDKWRRKSLGRLKQGRPAAVEFESTHIEPALAAAILGELDNAETPEAVKAVFDNVDWVGYP